uniref:Thioredoxin domain-containing protein n=1 Tax=Magallana gigas TaxID=29159 RepID=K1P767_MAGGI
MSVALAAVVDVSYKNLDKVRKAEPFSVFLIVTKNCEKCRLLYPKFVAASQAFKGDTSVLFGRVKDTKLTSEWEVTSFPSLVFFEKGGKHPMKHRGDITVDTVTEFVSRALGRDSATIIFLRLDVLREPNLAEQFETRQYPSLYWYPDDERPEKARYGGKMDDTQILEFIKDQTGIQRTKSGALVENAGRLADLDRLISEQIHFIEKVRNMDLVITEAKRSLAKYYIFLLKEIKKAKSIDILDDERAAINRALSEDPGPKSSEALIKMRNIIYAFVDATGKDLHKNTAESKFVVNREAREVKLQIDEELVYLDNGEEYRATGDGRTVKLKKKGKQKNKTQGRENRHSHHHDEL